MSEAIKLPSFDPLPSSPETGFDDAVRIKVFAGNGVNPPIALFLAYCIPGKWKKELGGDITRAVTVVATHAQSGKSVAFDISSGREALVDEWNSDPIFVPASEDDGRVSGWINVDLRAQEGPSVWAGKYRVFAVMATLTSNVESFEVVP